MDRCTNFLGVLKSDVTEDKQRLLAVARCKQWSCRYCAAKNKSKWRALILDCINKSDRQWSWFTITAHKSTHKHTNVTGSTYKNLRGVFSKLIKRARRKFGNDIIYVRIFEQHKSGALHIHCIWSVQFDDIVTRNRGKKNQYNDSKWLRQTVPKLGGGYMTHADNIPVGKEHFAAGYVTKYMTKTDENETFNLKGIRRIQSSRHIKFSGNGDSDLKFKLSSGYFESEFFDDLRNRIEPYSVTEKRKLEVDDFVRDVAYPNKPEDDTI